MNKIKAFIKYSQHLLVVLFFGLVSAVSFGATGKQVFIPIGVGDITTFIPLMPAPNSVNVVEQPQSIGESLHQVSWQAVNNASYYQINITDENGEISSVTTTELEYTLSGLPLGSSNVELLACNAQDQCGASSNLGTFTISERIRYAVADILGSPILEADQAGNVINEFHYKPYGDTEEQKREDIGYTGHLEDTDLALTYMQARYYDPILGRFYSNDPVGFAPSNPMSFNRYAYANNNPYKYTDPDGEWAQIAIGAVVGAVINTAVYAATTDFSNMSAGQVAAGLGRSAVIGGAVGAATTVGAGAVVAAQLGAVRTAAGVVGSGFVAGSVGEIANQSIASGELGVSDPGAVLAAGAGNGVGAAVGLKVAAPAANAISGALSDAGSDGTAATIRSLSGKPFKPMGYRAPTTVTAPQGVVDVVSETAGGAAGAGVADRLNEFREDQ